jgi:hypothetical protein
MDSFSNFRLDSANSSQKREKTTHFFLQNLNFFYIFSIVINNVSNLISQNDCQNPLKPDSIRKIRKMNQICGVSFPKQTIW